MWTFSLLWETQGTLCLHTARCPLSPFHTWLWLLGCEVCDAYQAKPAGTGLVGAAPGESRVENNRGGPSRAGGGSLLVLLLGFRDNLVSVIVAQLTWGLSWLGSGHTRDFPEEHVCK